MENFIPLIFMVPTAIALGVIANYMPRRSVRGNELTAKSKALRNWLRDFSSLDERPPTDVKVWGEFMVYAYLFGVADQAIKAAANHRAAAVRVRRIDGHDVHAVVVLVHGRPHAAGTAMPSVSICSIHPWPTRVDGAVGDVGRERELLERRRLRRRVLRRRRRRLRRRRRRPITCW